MLRQSTKRGIVDIEMPRGVGTTSLGKWHRAPLQTTVRKGEGWRHEAGDHGPAEHRMQNRFPRSHAALPWQRGPVPYVRGSKRKSAQAVGSPSPATARARAKHSVKDCRMELPQRRQDTLAPWPELVGPKATPQHGVTAAIRSCKSSACSKRYV